jgi:hypothetical protein
MRLVSRAWEATVLPLNYTRARRPWGDVCAAQGGRDGTSPAGVWTITGLLAMRCRAERPVSAGTDGRRWARLGDTSRAGVRGRGHCPGSALNGADTPPPRIALA